MRPAGKTTRPNRKTTAKWERPTHAGDTDRSNALWTSSQAHEGRAGSGDGADSSECHEAFNGPTLESRFSGIFLSSHATMIDAWRFADIEEGTPMASRVFFARGDIAILEHSQEPSLAF